MKKILSNAEIESLGSKMVDHFFCGMQYDKEWIDIDALVQGYLGLKVVYVTIMEENMDKIGFLADGKTTILIKEYGKLKRVCYPENTIILDRHLLRPEENAKRRFTLAHEAGHYILNRTRKLKTQAAFRTSPLNYQDVNLNVIMDICNLEEIQANRIAAVLLMPEGLLNLEMNKILGKTILPMYGGDLISPADKAGVEQIINHLQVSYTAFYNRLKELKRIEWRPQEELLKIMFDPKETGYEPW